MKNTYITIAMVLFLAACTVPATSTATSTDLNVKEKNCRPGWAGTDELADNQFVGVSESTSLKLGRSKARADAVQQVAQHIQNDVLALVTETANTLAGQDVINFMATFEMTADTAVRFAKDKKYSECPTNNGNMREYYVLVEYDVQKEVDHYNKLLEAHMKKEEYKQAKAEHKAQVQEMRDYLKEKSAANTSSDSSDS